MTGIVKHIIRFALFAFFQVLILNNLELGWGVYPMLYPLFIFLLPFEMATVTLLLIAFFFGMTPLFSRYNDPFSC